MVDRFYFDAQGLTFGDKISLDEKEFNVCGIFTTPDYLSMLKSETDFMADGNKFGLCMVSESAFNEISQGKEIISYSVIFNENNSDKFRKEISNAGNIINWTDKTSNIRISTFDGEIAAIILLSKIAPLFILIVSSLIMAVVLNRMLKKEYVYIGTLSALGYRKREIIFHYLRLPIIISLIGSVIGLGIGLLLVDLFSVVSSTEYNIPKPEYQYQIIDIFIVLISPIILNSIAAMIAITKALSLNIA